MGWREDVEAVTKGEPHGPLLTGISGGVFPCACGERFSRGWVTYRHGSTKPPKIGNLPVILDRTMPPDRIVITSPPA